jgi:hypothetical protein
MQPNQIQLSLAAAAAHGIRYPAVAAFTRERLLH